MDTEKDMDMYLDLDLEMDPDMGTDIEIFLECLLSHNYVYLDTVITRNREITTLRYYL
jgi:hypothetical protein